MLSNVLQEVKELAATFKGITDAFEVCDFDTEVGCFGAELFLAQPGVIAHFVKLMQQEGGSVAAGELASMLSMSKGACMQLVDASPACLEQLSSMLSSRSVGMHVARMFEHIASCGADLCEAVVAGAPGCVESLLSALSSSPEFGTAYAWALAELAQGSLQVAQQLKSDGMLAQLADTVAECDWSTGEDVLKALAYVLDVVVDGSSAQKAVLLGVEGFKGCQLLRGPYGESQRRLRRVCKRVLAVLGMEFEH
jgi:hypothetical protein